jgi:hypothetical protein
MEATKRYARKSLTTKVEKDLERDMGKAFAEQGLVMAKGFARLSYLFSESAVDKSLDPLFDAAEAATFEVMEGGMTDASVKALALGHQALAAEMGMQLSFDVANPYAASYLQVHGAAMVTNINETTRTAIQGLVTEGVENGWSYTKTAEELIHKYKEFAIGKPQEHIDGRAHLIAVTETGNAYMEGQFALMDTMAGMGLPMEKAWSTMGDDRVSDECEENESAGWIAFDEPFPSGDMHPLRFPGCRCDMEERMAEDTELPAELAGEEPIEYLSAAPEDMLMQYDNWYNNLSAGEMDTIGNYTGDGYMNLNGYLRRGGDVAPPGSSPATVKYYQDLKVIIESEIRDFENVIANSPGLPNNTVLYRNVRMKDMAVAIRKGEIVVGDTIVDKGFCSTTTSEIYKMKNAPVRWVISAEKGTKGAYVAFEELTNYVYEQEFILNHGTKFLVTRISAANPKQILVYATVVK